MTRAEIATALRAIKNHRPWESGISVYAARVKGRGWVAYTVGGGPAMVAPTLPEAVASVITEYLADAVRAAFVKRYGPIIAGAVGWAFANAPDKISEWIGVRLEDIVGDSTGKNGKGKERSATVGEA